MLDKLMDVLDWVVVQLEHLFDYAMAHSSTFVDLFTYVGNNYEMIGVLAVLIGIGAALGFRRSP